LQLLRTLKKRSPASKVIVRSMYDEFSVVRAAMGVGVNGFILTRAIATDILDAITSVLSGASYISPCIHASSETIRLSGGAKIKDGGRNEA